MSLLGMLPAPKHLIPADDDGDDPMETQTTALVDPRNNAPPYGRRKGWIPRTQNDFGDGGAFPEIHVAQYPLGMGHKDTKGSSVVSLSIGADGKVKYDAIINQSRDKDVTVYSTPADLLAKRDAREEYAKPDEEEERRTAERTQAALEKIVGAKIAAAQPSTQKVVTDVNANAKYIRYTPAQAGAQYNSGAQNRVIRMVEAQRDPLEPPKFKHKKVPAGPPSPPVPVMHSPPRKLTAKDQADWKIPPCISNWKNAKGYTIPLDKRLAADGRGLQEVQINDNFAKLSEALYIAERQAREEVNARNNEQVKINMKLKESKEEELRQMAAQFREEKGSMSGLAGAVAKETKEERELRIKREHLREDRRRDRERAYAIEKLGAESKKSKIARDRERDVSEKIALGMAQPSQSHEAQYDQRLFNQSEGMGNALEGDDSAYNVYDKPLFSQKSSSLYRPGKLADDDREFESDPLKRSKPARDFAGVDSGAAAPARTKPVEFEKEDEPDPFGLDQFMTDAKQAKGKSEKTYARDRQ